MNVKTEDLKSLLAAVVIPQAAGGIGAVATASSVKTWYQTLKKPAWNPPSWIFGPVWTILYLMMGVASWLVWREQGRGEEKKTALAWYGTQLGLNTLWSLVFFGLRRIGLAGLEIGLLWTAILGTAVRFYRLRPLAGLLLVPYALWTTFAAILNATVWRLNK
jgi:translocator protein